jgi:hypothetical protein
MFPGILLRGKGPFPRSVLLACPVSLARKARLSRFAHFAWVLRDHFWLAQVQQQPLRASD